MSALATIAWQTVRAHTRRRGLRVAAVMSLLSLCDRMCGTAAWLVPVTYLRGVRVTRFTFCAILPAAG